MNCLDVATFNFEYRIKYKITYRFEFNNGKKGNITIGSSSTKAAHHSLFFANVKLADTGSCSSFEIGSHAAAAFSPLRDE